MEAGRQYSLHRVGAQGYVGDLRHESDRTADPPRLGDAALDRHHPSIVPWQPGKRPQHAGLVGAGGAGVIRPLARGPAGRGPATAIPLRCPLWRWPASSLALHPRFPDQGYATSDKIYRACALYQPPRLQSKASAPADEKAINSSMQSATMRDGRRFGGRRSRVRDRITGSKAQATRPRPR